MTEPKSKGVRTCIVCRCQSGKRDLKRIVRCSDGSVRYDATGRLPGRGAYVCSVDCMNAALRTRKLQGALKVAVSAEDTATIAEELVRAFEEDEGR